MSSRAPSPCDHRAPTHPHPLPRPLWTEAFDPSTARIGIPPQVATTPGMSGLRRAALLNPTEKNLAAIGKLLDDGGKVKSHKGGLSSNSSVDFQHAPPAAEQDTYRGFVKEMDRACRYYAGAFWRWGEVIVSAAAPPASPPPALNSPPPPRPQTELHWADPAEKQKMRQWVVVRALLIVLYLSIFAGIGTAIFKTADPAPYLTSIDFHHASQATLWIQELPSSGEYRISVNATVAPPAVFADAPTGVLPGVPTPTKARPACDFSGMHAVVPGSMVCILQS